VSDARPPVMPTPPSPLQNSKRTLQNVRENEERPNPHYCLAAAKFTAGKLVGLFTKNERLRTFIHSDEGQACKSKIPQAGVASVWGWDITHNNPVFNEVVLPATISWSASPAKPDGVDFIYSDSAQKADELLNRGVPLVTRVTLGDKSGYGGHWVVVIKGKKHVWAVDVWEKKNDNSVATLPDNMTFDIQKKRLPLGSCNWVTQLSQARVYSLGSTDAMGSL
jgi:hypothetical protein